MYVCVCACVKVVCMHVCVCLCRDSHFRPRDSCHPCETDETDRVTHTIASRTLAGWPDSPRRRRTGRCRRATKRSPAARRSSAVGWAAPAPLGWPSAWVCRLCSNVLHTNIFAPHRPHHTWILSADVTSSSLCTNGLSICTLAFSASAYLLRPHVGVGGISDAISSSVIFYYERVCVCGGYTCVAAIRLFRAETYWRP